MKIKRGTFVIAARPSSDMTTLLAIDAVHRIFGMTSNY